MRLVIVRNAQYVWKTYGNQLLPGTKSEILRVINQLLRGIKSEILQVINQLLPSTKSRDITSDEPFITSYKIKRYYELLTSYYEL